MVKSLAAGTGELEPKALAWPVPNATPETMAGICQRSANGGGIGGTATLWETRPTVRWSGICCQYSEGTWPRINGFVHQDVQESNTHRLRNWTCPTCPRFISPRMKLCFLPDKPARGAGFSWHVFSSQNVRSCRASRHEAKSDRLAPCWLAQQEPTF
jgi:hypothetical protein